MVKVEKQKAKLKVNQVQQINEAEFDVRVLNCRQPVVVGFLAEWSQASERLKPVLEQVAGACNGNAKIFMVDVDDNPELGTLYAIQSVPTLIYFSDGSIRLKIVGTVSAKAILAKLSSLTPRDTSTKDVEPSRG